MKFAMLGVLVPALLASACTVREEDSAAENDPDAAQDLTPEGPSLIGNLFGGGEPQPLDIQQPHPNGVVLQLTSLQAKPTETIMVATIINGDDQEQSLNRVNNKNTYIVTGDGSKLYLSPPTSNPRLLVPAGQRMQAELVFLGRLPQGGNATLFINEGSASDSEYTTSPGFRIPLPITDLAFSDDGSKKN